MEIFFLIDGIGKDFRIFIFGYGYWFIVKYIFIYIGCIFCNYIVYCNMFIGFY